MHGPMWAGLTPGSNGGSADGSAKPDRRRQETPYLSARRKGVLPASPGGPARQVPGKKNWATENNRSLGVYDDHSDLLFFFRNQTELISYTLLQGKLRRLGVQCMSTYARACISIRFCPSCVLVLHCVRAVTSFTLLRPPTCRTWASRWRLVLRTLLPGHRPALVTLDPYAY